MRRFFNTAGPCDPDDHYMLSPLRRLLDEYLDGLGLRTGWLVIFDQRADAEPTATRTRRESTTSPAGREITVVVA